MDNEKNEQFIFGVIDRFEEEKAIIKLEDGQKISWNKKYLSKDSKEGDVLKIKAVSAPMEAQSRQELAKKILGEILKKDE